MYLVEGEWVNAFLAECEGFPNSSSHDDQIDAVSMAYEMVKNRLRGRSVSTMKLSGLYK
jgi:predicted phage terminase large subunit-like protein